MALLRINKVNAHYGAIKALWDVSLNVGEGEVVAVLGANGAGKTTLVKSIVGLIEPTSGMIKFAGQRIEGRDPHRISELGIAYGPEGGGLFRDMNVRENLELGAFHRRAWERRLKTLDRVYRLFPRLEERERAMSRTLSGGERQMLVIGRALMALPTLCIFDEPSIGMSPLLVDQAFHVIRQLRDEGITVLLIEQNVRKSLEIADRAYVLENGRVVLEGGREELLGGDLIKKAYLGL
ncbi:MAG TPA: ABC transporter ATP-binding protein [Acidimicrobiia bacterium]|nr:ABC transporter ATP-binding protein [Acidimicrobiia bacterium]